MVAPGRGGRDGGAVADATASDVGAGGPTKDAASAEIPLSPSKAGCVLAPNTTYYLNFRATGPLASECGKTRTCRMQVNVL